MAKFLLNVKVEEKEWYYAINGDVNHPSSLCSLLGMAYEETMVILEAADLARKGNNQFNT